MSSLSRLSVRWNASPWVNSLIGSNMYRMPRLSASCLISSFRSVRPILVGAAEAAGRVGQPQRDLHSIPDRGHLG